MDSLACPGVRLTRISRIVAYQIHERCDGSGYPRGMVGDDLHVLSKIAAVADAYVGLVSNRWHRKALMPYYAMEKMLHSIPQGLFDPKRSADCCTQRLCFHSDRLSRRLMAVLAASFDPPAKTTPSR